MQMGLNDASGATTPAGPATATVVPLTAPDHEQVLGITMSFTVTAGTTAVPVVVDQLLVGSDRIEGELVAFAIASPFPSDLLSSTIATFEQRLVSQGGGASA
jgi:hypothetical protein